MARVLRGEVYWADLNPGRGREQAGLGPVLVISREYRKPENAQVLLGEDRPGPHAFSGAPTDHIVEGQFELVG